MYETIYHIGSFFQQISELQELLKELSHKRLLVLQDTVNKENLTQVNKELPCTQYNGYLLI